MARKWEVLGRCKACGVMLYYNEDITDIEPAVVERSDGSKCVHSGGIPEEGMEEENENA